MKCFFLSPASEIDLSVFKRNTSSCPAVTRTSPWDGNIPWTSPRDLAGHDEVFLLKTDKSISEAGLKKISSELLPAGTLLLSSRAPIGYIAIASRELAINQGYIAFLPDATL